VLTVIYLLFNEGYLATAGPPASRDLAEDAEWLAGLLYQLMPAEPEVAGLLALIRLHRARSAARFGVGGGLVLLRDQDRSRWDREAITEAVRLLTRTARRQHPGPYQLQAAIVAFHAEAGRFGDTDWEQIVLLYDMLLHLAPSPVTRLHRAIAVRCATGAAAAMAELDDLAGVLGDYHLYHATRAELLRELGHPGQVRAEDRRALELTANPGRASPAPAAPHLDLGPWQTIQLSVRRGSLRGWRAAGLACGRRGTVRGGLRPAGPRRGQRGQRITTRSRWRAVARARSTCWWSWPSAKTKPRYRSPSGSGWTGWPIGMGWSGR
jgi:hypothetical protein